MEETEVDDKFQCSKCGELCNIWSQYNLVMCPVCKSINDISTECNEDDEI